MAAHAHVSTPRSRFFPIGGYRWRSQNCTIVSLPQFGGCPILNFHSPSADSRADTRGDDTCAERTENTDAADSGATELPMGMDQRLPAGFDKVTTRRAAAPT